MKTESLRALLIDHELGELPPEVAELLKDWLAKNPGRAAELGQMRETLAITGETVRRFPELGAPDSKIVPIRRPRLPMIPFAMAASVLLLLGLSAWLGFRAGRDSEQQNLVAENARQNSSAPASLAHPSAPWAQYALVSSPQGGLTVVRSDQTFNP